MDIIFSIIILLNYFLFRKKISSKIVLFLFDTYTIAFFLMLIIPLIWHYRTGFSDIGVLWSYVSRQSVRDMLPEVFFAIFYVNFISCLGFLYISKRNYIIFLNKLNTVICEYNNNRKIYIAIFYFVCLGFLVSYFSGSFKNIMLMRMNSVAELPPYFEFLRGGTVVACTYATVVLSSVSPKKNPFIFLIVLVLFFGSLGLMSGSGSRHLLLYPIMGFLVTIFFSSKPKIDRRKLFIGSLLIVILFCVAVVQTVYRDYGYGVGGVGGNGLKRVFLAFDQLSAMLLAFDSRARISSDLIARMPFSGFFDVFTHFIPRSLFSAVGLKKMTYAGYLEWNNYIVSGINSNVTPSYIGQFFIQNDLFGVLQLPFVFILVVFVFLRLIRISLGKIVNNETFNVCIALLAGGIFNSVRFLGGGYFLYLVLFMMITALVRVVDRRRVLPI